MGGGWFELAIKPNKLIDKLIELEASLFDLLSNDELYHTVLIKCLVFNCTINFVVAAALFFMFKHLSV